MYCNTCGKTLVGVGVFCQTCGARADAPQQSQQPVQDFTAQIPATKTAYANPMAWLLLVTAITCLLAAVGFRYFAGQWFGRYYAGGVTYSFAAIIVLNLIVAAVVCIVWQKGGRRLAKTVIIAVAIGTVLAAALFFLSHRILFPIFGRLIGALDISFIAVENIRTYVVGFPLAAANLALSAKLIADGRKGYFIISRAFVALLAILGYYLMIDVWQRPIDGFFAFAVAELIVLIVNIILVVTRKNRQN